jgi:cysteine-rich repeat protein
MRAVTTCALALSFGLPACASNDTSGEGGTESATGTDGTSASETDATTSQDTTTTETDSAGGVCGDGVVDPDEECDDGNPVDADGCNVDCAVSGSQVWSKTISMPFNAVPEGIAVDSTHAVLAAVKDVDGDRAWLIKLDDAGGPAWEIEDTSDDRTWIYALDVDGMDRPVVAGLRANMDGTVESHPLRTHLPDGTIDWEIETDQQIGGVDVFGADAIATAGGVQGMGSDIVVEVFDADGVSQWRDDVAGPEDAGAHAIAASPTGALVVVGVTSPGGEFVTWMRAYDASHVESWTQVGSDPTEAWNEVALHAAGGFVTGGMSDAKGRTRRWTDEPAQVWTQTLEGADMDGDGGVWDLAVDGAGNVISCGGVSAASPPSIAAVRKYDPAGVELWTVTDDGSESYCDSIAVDDADFVYTQSYFYATQDVVIRKLNP